MDERALVTNRRLAEADGFSPTPANRRARKKNARVPRKLRKEARELAADVACNPPAPALLPPKKSRPGARAKGDPLAHSMALVARELAQLLVETWPGLNADGMPDGGYAMARGLVAEVVYGELARMRGMKCTPIDAGAAADMRAACDRMLDRIQRLPLADITPDHFGCVHEALSGCHFEGGKVVPNNGRRKTGTHFTPPDLAMKVTSRTVEPLLACINDQSPLVLRVCDPAVGAGAFLLALMRMLAPRVLERGDAKTLDQAKRLVAIHCCYGVDRSRFAVHSCKLALALEARADRMPRDWLDDNVKHGDALVGLSNEQIKKFHWQPSAEDHPQLATLLDLAMTEAATSRSARVANLSSAARGAA